MPGVVAADGQDASAPGMEQLVSELRENEDLRVFLEAGFEPARHVGQAVREGRVAAELQNSQRAEAILSARVREEVIERKEALLAEVEAVAALEKEVSTVADGVSTLSVASSALAEALEGPYLPMETSVRRMQNLCDAADLLAAVSRFRHCMKKMKTAGLVPIDPAMAGNPAVLGPAADALKELEGLIAPDSFTRLEKVDGLLKSIVGVKKASPELRRRAAAMLKLGLAERNQIEVEAAVSAFYSLGVLPDRVNSEIARLLSDTQSVLHRGLEAPRILLQTGKRGSGSSSSANSFPSPADRIGTRNIHVWNSVEKMFDTIAEACCKAILLQQVLSKKYCDVTHLSLLHEPIASNFMDSIAKALKEQISILTRTRHQRQSANLVFSALAEGFPKLRLAVSDVVARVDAFARVSPPPITGTVQNPKYPFVPNHAFIEKTFMDTITEIETHHLTASLDRLTSAVESSFGQRAQPSESEALAFAKLLAQELSAARDDKKLLQIATNNVATVLRLYKSHADDYAAATAPDVGNRRASRGPTEWHLLGLHNGIVTLATYARRVLGVNEGGTGELPESISKEIDNLSNLAGLFLDGPFSQCREEVQRSMMRLHTENLEGGMSDEGCSVYVMDVAAQLSLFADGIIGPLARSTILGQKTLELARWVVSTFVQHISMVESMSEIIRMRLSTDIARLELAVESICTVRVLGKSYKGLRAIRSMLLIPVADLLKPDEAFLDDMKCLDKSVLASLLISRANLKSFEHPHRRKNMTVDKYIAWMDQHSEEDIWNEIEASLTAYETNTKPEDRCSEYDAIMHLGRTL